MCGIAGVYQRDGKPVPVEAVKAMGLRMSHRGPDNMGLEVRPAVVMSHNRLSLLDLSQAANQPFCNERYVLVYNGEIYNFKDLRERIGKSYRIEFKTTSDTEVLFNLLILEGVESALSQIRGMFAFAFYDQEMGELYLARDRMGIKPLYFYSESDNFYWASEIKALVTTLNLPPEPVRTLFAANNMAEKSNEFTLFKGVKSVKPGTFLRIGQHGATTEVAYYDLLDDLDPNFHAELHRASRLEITRYFESLFTESVKAMLVSDAPIGAFVSGGVDSSLISAIASRQNADIKLFTANVVGKDSELDDVVTLSRHLKKDFFEYRFEPEMMLRDWVNVTYYYDAPIVIHVNSIPFSNVARLARDSGVKAVLTGEGADELFLGYPRLLTKRYESLAQFPVSGVKSLYRLFPRLHKHLFPNGQQSPVSFINGLVQGFEAPQLEEKAMAKLNGRIRSDREGQLLTIRLLREHLVTLLHRNDRMGMMASIEARFPFLDENIVRFAVNLPSRFKISLSTRLHNYKHPFLTDKWIVRKVAEEYLPSALVYKKKKGFPVLGHKYVRLKDSFFSDGWLADALGLGTETQRFFIKSQDPYFVAKLASVELFGRIYGLGHSLEAVQRHLMENAEIIKN